MLILLGNQKLSRFLTKVAFLKLKQTKEYYENYENYELKLGKNVSAKKPIIIIDNCRGVYVYVIQYVSMSVY